MTVAEMALDRVVKFHRRPVSISEYYHASVGCSERTLDRPRECVLIFEGALSGDAVDIERWRQALLDAAHANPGSFVAMRGRGLFRHWNSDGDKPCLRIIEDCQWEGLSSEGSEFIYQTPLGCSGESSVELIVVTGVKSLVIFRALHAVMDGLGIVNFAEDFFRCLRNESPHGTNIAVSDVELMRSLPSSKSPRPKGRPAFATGGPKGDSHGDCWRRIAFTGVKPKILLETILAVAAEAYRYSDNSARIAMPVSLYRHLPGMRSTMNYTSMVHIDVLPEDTVKSISRKIKTLLDANAEICIPAIANIFKLLPMHWIDQLVSRSAKNYKERRIIETAVISYLGRFKAEVFSGGGFLSHCVYTVPIPGNTMISISALDKEISVTLGVENVYASEGRLDDLVARLQAALA